MSATRVSMLRGLLIVLALAGASYAMGRPDQAASQAGAAPVPCAGPMAFSAPPGTPTPGGSFPRTVHLSPPLMSFPSSLGAVQVDQRTGRLYALSSPADRYALGCGTLWVLDVATGKVSPFAQLPYLGAAVADNAQRQLFTLADGTLSAWDVSTGKQRWAHSLPTPCVGTLALATTGRRLRRVFTLHNGTPERGSLGDDGYLRTFDAATGRRLNVRDVGFAAWPAILAVGGRRGVILADVHHFGADPPTEDLELLDPATGNLRRTLSGPHDATAAAVDPWTGQIFVLAGPEKDGWSVWLLDPTTGRASRLMHGLKLGGNPLLYQVLVAGAARPPRCSSSVP